MEPPNPGAIDMRHTKLKASEAALIAGELVKPTWASRNEGIHERVSFEDTLWGFEMAGGAYYKTPLRVCYVRPDSRAEHACIRMGDTVLRINGQDTSSLTLQEAHKLVKDAGINLKIVVTSPEDKVNAQYAYEDPMAQEHDFTAEQLKAMELERVRRALERASHCRELPWPWVRRKWVIYRESNCFMVPSKYENKHRDKFPELPPEKLNYFLPAEKKNQAKNNEDKANIMTEKKVDEPLEEEEEYEEVEEEVEEEEIEEEEVREEDVVKEDVKVENENVNEEGNERLEDNISENVEVNDTDNLETETNNSSINTIEDLQQKDSNHSASNYELDSNNNHVAKHKDEKNIDEIQNDYTDDKILDEIVQNSNKTSDENLAKSDDDIIDSVLNDNVGSELENER